MIAMTYKQTLQQSITGMTRELSELRLEFVGCNSREEFLIRQKIELLKKCREDLINLTRKLR